MTQILARSALVLFATTALGACATPTYAVTLADAARLGAPAPARSPDARVIQAGDRGEAPAELILAATHHRHAAKPAPKSADDEADAPTTYKVRRGDTLAKIADKLGVGVSELKRANKIKGVDIDVGQVLKVPGAESKPATHRKSKAKAEPTTYRVERGDTLFSISKKLGVSIDDLRDANGLSARGSIHAGQTLKLPGAEPAAEDEAPAPKKNARASSRRQPADRETAEASDGGQAAGRLVEVEGPPTTYKVRKGDSLEKVADKLDTDVASLKKDNRIKGSTIRPGQVLKGPRTVSKAYVARSGDTLADIARRFGVTTEKLRAANGLSRRAAIRSGQKLVLPAGYRDHGAIAAPRRAEEERHAAPRRVEEERASPPTSRPRPYSPPSSSEEAQSTAPERSAPSVTPRPYVPPAVTSPRPYSPPYSPPSVTARPYSPPYSPPSATPRPYSPPAGVGSGPPLAPQAAAQPTDSQISELGRGRFQWPLKGQIISDFGPKTPGQRNDGVNLRANAGDPVRAAAAGDVVYAGDQVPGFGNLVLVKHADGWVTAYGHLSRVEVKMQQKVSQGQEIGEAGSTGGVSEPQLHFEVRYAPNPLERARPIDPKLVLPR